ncbi:MAG TPA: helix-turn-helix domain-containing protein [Acidimicrobiales bacterium]|nr:helix-turn-helix domain-containing protein [Acidimicrobiales bacterium]
MTARDDARRGRADVRDTDRAYAPEAGPTLPERLIAARERKGVDLLRAERETKIRARYLAALEAGDYADLPGSVYTKGFLRNYALYLGLDPEDVTRQWKRERGDLSLPAEPVLNVPRPLEAPRQGLAISPVLVVAGLLVVLIAAFGVYIGLQLLRYAKPPTVAVTDPAQAVVSVADGTTSYTLRGTSIPGATITITDPGLDQPYSVSADGSGRWTADVQLRRGRNEFDVSAVDPETGKVSDSTLKLFITVPVTVVEAPGLTLNSPADGAQFSNGAIPVNGTTTNAAKVTLAANRVTASGATSSAKPGASPSARPGASPTTAPAHAGSPDVGPVSVDVGSDGSFDSPLNLSTGNWVITVTAVSADGKTTALTRHVSIQYQGVNLVIQVKGARAWLKVWVDGTLSPVTGAGGVVYDPGKVLTFTAQHTIEVRTGKSSATYFTLNGQSLGHMSTAGNPETWLFAPPAPPQKTNRT